MESKQMTNKEKEPEFVKLYIDRIAAFKSISPADTKVLLVMASMADWDNEVRTPASERIEISKATGLGESTIRASIANLVGAGFIHKRAASLYLLDPSYFSKKSWNDIVKQKLSFEMRAKYSVEHGEQISVEVCE
jgi:predicted transcriptional regulator